MGGPQQPDGNTIHTHASCVAVEDRALLIRGASGSGKSALALQMMGLGAQLVSDDQVILRVENGRVLASAPDSIRGLIEMRGVGLLHAEAVQNVPVQAVLDLDQTETERLPEARRTDLLGQQLTLLFRAEGPHFAAGLVQFLKAGRRDP